MDVEYTKEPVLDEKELEEKCFEMYPDHPMLKMKACLEIMEKKNLEKEDVTGIETVLDTLPVKPALPAENADEDHFLLPRGAFRRR